MTDAFGIPTAPSERGFGDIEHRKHGALQGQSLAMHEAATNLLHKAVAALEAEQTDKAMTYLRKAERLPYDDYGAASPLSLAAHMYAFRAVLDAHELGHGLWVDAADIVLEPMATWKPLAMADFRHVLIVVRDDYPTTAAEDRRLHRMVTGQQVATIREMQELAGEELCAVVLDLLAIVIEYDVRVGMILDERGIDDH